MAVTIPCVPNDGARWIQRTSLAGRDYVLSFDWIERAGHWIVSIADQDSVDIVTGIVLVVGAALLRGVTDTRCPPGDLLVVDTTGRNDIDPGYTDLGARFQLVYFDPGEIPA